MQKHGKDAYLEFKMINKKQKFVQIKSLQDKICPK